LKKFFFGYLPNKSMVCLRIVSFIFIALSPFIYYKTIEGIFIEDIFAMIVYSGANEIIFHWFFSILFINLLSYLGFKISSK